MKVLLVLSIYFLLVFIVNKVLRFWLKVEKKTFFSYNHLNDKHKKVDWTIRFTFLFILTLGWIINFNRIEKIWFLETYVLGFIFIIVSETVRAIMEWKYAENRNDYLFTSIQLVLITLFLITVYTTNFFYIF